MNLRPSAPKADALPTCATPRWCDDNYTLYVSDVSTLGFLCGVLTPIGLSRQPVFRVTPRTHSHPFAGVDVSSVLLCIGWCHHHVSWCGVVRRVHFLGRVNVGGPDAAQPLFGGVVRECPGTITGFFSPVLVRRVTSRSHVVLVWCPGCNTPMLFLLSTIELSNITACPVGLAQQGQQDLNL